jgi:hypothetical protein
MVAPPLSVFPPKPSVVSAIRVGVTGKYVLPPDSIGEMDADAGEAPSAAAKALIEARGSRRPTLSASRPARPLLLPDLSAGDRENRFIGLWSP